MHRTSGILSISIVTAFIKIIVIVMGGSSSTSSWTGVRDRHLTAMPALAKEPVVGVMVGLVGKAASEAGDLEVEGMFTANNNRSVFCNLDGDERHARNLLLSDDGVAWFRGGHLRIMGCMIRWCMTIIDLSIECNNRLRKILSALSLTYSKVGKKVQLDWFGAKQPRFRKSDPRHFSSGVLPSFTTVGTSISGIHIKKIHVSRKTSIPRKTFRAPLPARPVS